jgi:hypothetical protein
LGLLAEKELIIMIAVGVSAELGIFRPGCMEGIGVKVTEGGPSSLRKTGADSECQPKRRVKDTKRQIASLFTEDTVKCDIGTRGEKTHSKSAIKNTIYSSG